MGDHSLKYSSLEWQIIFFSSSLICVALGRILLWLRLITRLCIV